MTTISTSIDKVPALRVRLLHPEFDLTYFHQAWRWREDKPDWYKKSIAVWGMGKTEYFSNLKNDSQLDFGILDGNRLIGLITLEEIAPAVLEAHIDCERQTKIEQLTLATRILKQHAFDNGVILIFVWVQSFNRPILSLYKTVGFLPTNISIFRGSYKNKVIEWKQFYLENKSK